MKPKGHEWRLKVLKKGKADDETGEKNRESCAISELICIALEMEKEVGIYEYYIGSSSLAKTGAFNYTLKS